MEGLMKRFFTSSIITSIVLAILGVLLFFQSKVTIIAISYIIGAILIALGVVAIIRFAKLFKSTSRSELDIIYGTVTIILGALIVANPEVIASVIPFVIGLGIIVNSATKLQYAFELKSCKNDQWKITLLISIISTICGVVLIFNPFASAVLLTKIVGAFIVAYAILDIISTIMIKRNVVKIHKAIDGNIKDAVIIDDEEK